MGQVELQAKAFVVVGTKAVDGVAKFPQLSRRYHAREAADDFAALCKAQGIDDAYVRVIRGRFPV